MQRILYLMASCATIALSLPVQAADAWPMPMMCTGRLLVFSAPGFSSAPLQATLHMDAPKETVRWASSFGKLVDTGESDTVRLDFSDGDAHSVFTFQREALRRLSTHDVDVVRGMYEEGVDWLDGYHTRSLEVVECRSLQGSL